MRLARRTQAIEPFYVMECAKAADELARSALCDPARGGRPMIYLNIGEPDFTATEPVREAAERSVIAIEQLQADIGITAKLGDFHMTEADLHDVAAEAMLSGNVAVNPRKPTLEDMKALLRAKL